MIVEHVKNPMKDQNEFFKKLKVTLEETITFPTEYIYKFIISSEEAKAKEIKDIFNHTGAVIKTKPSKTGKYKSLTIFVTMKDADGIIKKYKEVAKVEGVISL